MTAVLPVKTRDLNASINQLRDSGWVPGVLYGHGVTNQTVMVNGHELERMYRAAGESTLVDLTVDGNAPVKVLIYDVQHNPLSNALQHVDFYQVNMTEKLTTEIPLVFTGESPAVKALGGTLVTSLEEIEITCLPADLVKEITVDISSLATFADKITVSQLTIPVGIEVLTPGETAIATVAEPRAEEPESTPAPAAEAGVPVEGAVAGGAETKPEAAENTKTE